MSAEIELAVTHDPSLVLRDSVKEEEFYAHCLSEVEAHVPDVTTDKGRKAIAALAYKVTQSKTAIDRAGKLLNAKLREQVNAVDVERRKLWDKYEKLADQARAPLTEWEKAEAERAKEIDNIALRINAMGIILPGDTAEAVQARIVGLADISIDPSIMSDGIYSNLCRARLDVSNNLKAARFRLIEEAENMAELARLRAEADARRKADMDAMAQKALDTAKKEFEERRAADEERRRVESEARTAQAVKDAEEKARLKAERDVREAEERVRAEYVAEQKRLADADAKRLQEAALKHAEEEKRAANKKHRAKVIAEATAALSGLWFTGINADSIIELIVDGKVPKVEVKF